MISVREQEETGVTVIELGTRLTLENEEEFVKMAASLSKALAPRLVVNARDLTTVDSTGIGALITLKNSVVQTNGQFALVSLRPEIRRVLMLMNLHHVIEIYDTEDLATKAMISRRV